MEMDINNLAEWTMENFYDYFSRNKQLFGNSKAFDEISKLAKKLNKIDKNPVSYDMAYNRTQKLENILGATFEYSSSHANPHTAKGKERKKVVDAFFKICQKEKEYTDLSANVKFFEGKNLQEMKKGVNFKQLSELYDEAVKWENKEMNEENVIAHTNALSKAIQATEIFLKYQPEAVMFEKVKEREMAQDLWNTYQPCISSMRDLREVRRLINDKTEPKKNWNDLHALREATAEMTGKEKKVSANSSQRFKLNYNGKMGFFTQENYARQFDDAVDDYIQEHHKTKEDILIIKSRNFLSKKGLSLEATKITLNKLEIALKEEMQNQDISTTEGKEQYQVYQEILENPKAKIEMLNLWKAARGSHSSWDNGKFNDKDNLQMTDRNIATSRMAELLGIGNLIAHSEKMTVTVNGQSVNGCFMEFAEGIDLLNTNDREQLRVISQTSQDIAGGVIARDASNLQLFDTICAQQDRHAGNLFTKIGELGEDGKRAVTGIQGIDNDLAFSRRTDLYNVGRNGDFKNLIFVDAEFARKLNTLTREKVEYAVGDLLNSAEIDGIMTRLKYVNNHIEKNAIIIEGEEQWKLNKYSVDEDVDKLDEDGKKYVESLKDIQEAVKFGKYTFEIEKYNQAKSANKLRAATARYDKMLNEETELLGKVSNMFEQAEQDAKTFEKSERARENRAKIFDRLVAKKENAEKQQPAPEKRAVESINFQKLSAMEKSQNSFASIKANKEKMAKQKENQKQNEKQNERKAPMIGAHRAKK